MANGKKQYVISTAAYGITYAARNNRFKSHADKMRARKPSEQKQSKRGTTLDSTSRQKETMDFFNTLQRSDKFLEDKELGEGRLTPIDPIRTLSNRVWSVQGAQPDTKMIFCSGAMSQEADDEVYKSVPFDIVFSDHVVKTGDGVIPDAVEDKMTKWRDSKNGGVVQSGLFPVYQQNIKLLPIESAFNQYYLTLTGLTPEQIAKADEMAQNPKYGEQIKKTQVGSEFQKEGSVYAWHLMRNFIGKNARTVAASDAAYEDFSTYVNAPFNMLESQVMSFDGTTAYASCASEYNFYSMLYEKFSKHAPELLLPCMLLQTAADSELGDPETIKIANDNVTLGGAIKSATAGNLIGRKKKRDADAAEAMTISSMYWHEFGSVLSRVAKAASDSQSRGIPKSLDDLADAASTRQVLGRILRSSPAAAYAADKMRNLVFSGDYGRLISDTDRNRENYPMYADINFTADQFAMFSDFIDFAGLMPDLIDSLIASETGNVPLLQDVPRKKRPKRSSIKSIFEGQPKMHVVHRSDGGISMNQKQDIAPMKRRVFDVETWLYKLLNDEQDTQKMTGRLHAHASVIAGDGMVNTLEKQIKTIIALGKIKDMVSDYVRSYEQILKGETAYAETVVYQVRKSVRDARDRNGRFVQNFWFANSTDITNINFMDTQVHYGKEYVYEIFAHTLVIGTRYDIGNRSLDMSPLIKSTDKLSSMLKANDQSLKTMTFQDSPYSQAVWYTPALKIVKTRIHAESIMMFDSAPIVPEVEFVPYKGIDHKILCVFKGSVGRSQMPTIMINSDRKAYGPNFAMTEEQAVNLQRKYQKNEILPGENLLYESDDRPEFFEVYRLTKAPYSYKDFDGQLYARVTTRIPSEKSTYPASDIMPKYGDSASMVDIIAPNRKYYYMIRQVDVHGNFSNPSPVFEVEMVKQKEVIYPLIKEYIFKDPIPRTNKKYFNKYIKIAPTVQQVLITNTEATSAFDAANGAIQLGAADTNIWGKKYKVRITSTTTGKSADLNIQFNQKHKKSTTEIEGGDVVDKETGVRTKTKDNTAGHSKHRR
tara:strand:- start:12035 stop:15178 length:3144 start_codon:yes stop_codon:yes gene_type:complete